MLSDPTLLGFFIVVNLIALGMTYLAWKRPDWGRFLFGGMFLGAGLFNLYYTITDPEQFIYYADFVVLDWYKSFILGPFTRYLQIFLLLIALTQLVVGLGFWNYGTWLKWSALAGILFLLAIVPFGVGAAFPAPLTMTLGSYLLYRYRTTYSIATWVRKYFGSNQLSSPK